MAIPRFRRRANLADKSDAELLALTRERRDRDAFDIFYRRHQSAVLAFIAGSVGDHDLAQDIAAESFAIAFSKLDRFDPELGSGRQWLFGIARISMLARARKGGREAVAHRRLQSQGSGSDDIEAAEARLDSSRSTVVAGLDVLSTRERDAIVARVLEEREYAEIAERQDSSEVVVRQRVSRGLRKLARFLGGDGR